MAELPASRGERRSCLARRLVLHLFRLALFVLILFMLRDQALKYRLTQRAADPFELQRIRKFLPRAASLGSLVPPYQARIINDSSGEVLGYVLQTSPRCDHLLGFSGPTNVMVVLGPEERIVGINILASGDTRAHVRQVREDGTFLRSFQGLTPAQLGDRPRVDVVTGATLTSLAIQEAIVARLGGSRRAFRFPIPPMATDVAGLFPEAVAVVSERTFVEGMSGPLYQVLDRTGQVLGTLLRSSPAADNLIGYQGPTDTLIGLDLQQRVVGIAVGMSYDNEPYVTYVRADPHFTTLFNDRLLPELAQLDLQREPIEGVSGATMTSQAVAAGLVLAARRHLQAATRRYHVNEGYHAWTWSDWATGGLILSALFVGISSARSLRILQIGWKLLIIGFLGLWQGELLSQAMLVGWARNGVPWRNAGSLVLLAAAAWVVPVVTGRNIYCTHLCPHGALQQLFRNRLSWQVRPRGEWARVLRAIPLVLLVWCLLVGMRAWPYSLVNIEPFDAWIWRVASGATIAIAIIGLALSLLVPMAYCRYGCPTGAVLQYFRFHGRSDRWSLRDGWALGLTLLAAGLWWL